MKLNLLMLYRDRLEKLSHVLKDNALTELLGRYHFLWGGGASIRDRRSSIFSGPHLAHAKKIWPPLCRRAKSFGPPFALAKKILAPPLELKTSKFHCYNVVISL